MANMALGESQSQTCCVWNTKLIPMLRLITYCNLIDMHRSNVNGMCIWHAPIDSGSKQCCQGFTVSYGPINQ